MRPRILDLYCDQGGASMGYYLAGFDVIGVDLQPQRQYPFPICRRDSLDVLRDQRLLAEVDAIHASPPHCETSLLSPTLELLKTTGKPWVVENGSAAAKTPGSITLCGTHFGLGTHGRTLRRHRRFSSNVDLPQPGPCSCAGRTDGGVYSKITRSGDKFSPDEARAAMGVDWMSSKGLALAVPPDYTRWVGGRLMRRFWPQVPARDHHRDRYSSGRIEQFARL